MERNLDKPKKQKLELEEIIKGIPVHDRKMEKVNQYPDKIWSINELIILSVGDKILILFTLHYRIPTDKKYKII
jgi:hypothetical protein